MPFKSKSTRIIIPIVEMTPMIDIIFLLIIFFMVAAQFANQSKVDLQLPKETGEQLKNESPSTLAINIKEDGSILLDAVNSVSIDELNMRIQKLITEESGLWTDITIRADERARSLVLNEVLRVLNTNGLNATRIATESP
mgnify:CR=1 FL=1|tara:strand:- start:86 stop:505 length:420 start_codon:yes stop_codon:yes gene_type:complete